MMANIELLKLASKAAGYGPVIEMYGYNALGEPLLDANDPPTVWNPLRDDGDALRLAVKLGILVDTSDGVHVQYIVNGVALTIVEYEFYDIYAATRRTIVLAAAEMAKSMP